MMQHLNELDIPHFLFFFNIYQFTTKSSSDTIFFKAVALLLYLSEGNIVEFNKLIQTISIEEIENPHIEFVLKVQDCVLGFDFEGLKSLITTAHEKFRIWVQKIYERKTKSLDKALKDTGETVVATGSQPNVETVISDCLFIVEKFAGN